MTSDAHPVLVVEDDEDIRALVVEVLTSEGYAVYAAGHGADALAQLRAGCKPCLILLDLTMPVMDGWTFCKEREKDPSFAEIPVVVVSALARTDPRNVGMRAVDHLVKPLNIDKLLATVEQYC